MTCAHCGHSGPVHASSLDPASAPRVWCDDCRLCKDTADQARVPLTRVRRSHLLLLDAIAQAAGDGAPVARETATAQFESRRGPWAAPYEAPDALVRDLAEWGLVVREVGLAHPVAPTGARANTYDGSWAVRLTDQGQKLLALTP